MTDSTDERPTGVRLRLPDGSLIALELRAIPGSIDLDRFELAFGQRPPPGLTFWLAFGPPGRHIPEGAELEIDDLPDRHAIAVALRQGRSGQLIFRPPLELDDLPGWIPPKTPATGS